MFSQDGAFPARTGKSNGHRFAPLTLTLVAIVIFTMPIYICMTIAHSHLVKYWLKPGVVAWSLLVVPVLILVTHMVNTHRKMVSVPMVFTTFVLSGTLLVVYSMIQMTFADNLWNQLISIDCHNLQGKRQLEHSWREARDFYLGCIAETAREYNFSTEYLTESFRIEDCKGYAKAFADNKADWSYLQHLEDHQSCSGWCTFSQQMWSKAPTKGSCSTAVASYFGFYAYPRALQVATSMSLVLLLAVPFIAWFIDDLK